MKLLFLSLVYQGYLGIQIFFLQEFLNPILFFKNRSHYIYYQSFLKFLFLIFIKFNHYFPVFHLLGHIKNCLLYLLILSSIISNSFQGFDFFYYPYFFHFRFLQSFFPCISHTNL